ncbi:MAG: Spy/CpxP family protein refolding chaperone [Pirellulaceae bacterium]
MTRKFALILFVAAACVFSALNRPCLAQDGKKVSLENNPFGERIISALFDPRVQRELELMEDQQAQLKAIMDDIKSARQELGRELRAFSQTATPEEVAARREQAVAESREMQLKARTTVFEVLLPHQQERLSQLTAQVMIEHSAKNNEAGVLAPEMMRYLEIDEEQAARIRERTSEIREKLAEDIKRLTDQAREDMMQELTAEQREKYEQLTGEPIER